MNANEKKVAKLLNGNTVLGAYKTNEKILDAGFKSASELRIKNLENAILLCKSAVALNKELRSKAFKNKLAKAEVKYKSHKDLVVMVVGGAYSSFAEKVKAGEISQTIRSKFVKACKEDESLSASIRGLCLFAKNQSAKKTNVNKPTKTKEGGEGEAKDGGEETTSILIARFITPDHDVKLTTEGLDLGDANPKEVLAKLKLFVTKLEKSVAKRSTKKVK